MTQNKPKTLADIAKIAGVSPGTVSRALSNIELVNEKTRAKILEVVERYNYSPNLAARNLRTRKTGAIAVVIPLGHEQNQHLSDPFFNVMLGNLADELSDRGYDLLLSRALPKNENWLDDFINSGRSDGIIIIGQSDQSEIINKVAKSYLPMVVWGANENDQSTCVVGSDNRLGGMLGGVHLVERGCKKIVFFGDTSLPEITHRLEGCRTALQTSGYEDLLEIVETHLTAESSYETISSYFDANPLPDGIFAASDIIAMSALRRLGELKVEVPSQVKVLGYDDLQLATYTSPPLSSIRQDLKFGARKLVELLFRRINGEFTQSVIIPPSISVRESTRQN